MATPLSFALLKSGLTESLSFLHWFHFSIPSLNWARCSTLAMKDTISGGRLHWGLSSMPLEGL